MKLILKLLRYLLFVLGGLLAIIIVFLLVSIAPIDRTLPQEKAFYSSMMERLDSLKGELQKKPLHQFKVGFAVENLTPSYKTATAGYGNRRGKLYSSVRDSIQVRCLVIDNGAERIAIVSADLLIIPPTVTAILEPKLKAIGFDLDHTYLGAIHSHNSIGNWAKGATSFIYGAYDEKIVEIIANQIVKSIQAASKHTVLAKVKAGQIPVNAVRNRLDKVHGKVDSLLRVITIEREDHVKLALLTYTGHATCLFSRDLSLSRDYPGLVVDTLEEHGFDFAMFMAGAVGSHGCAPPAFGEDCITWVAEEIVSKFESHQTQLETVNDSSLFMYRTKLMLGEPQVKISKDWRIRPWLFRAAFGEYPVYLTALRIGDVVMIGTPCDFSGALDEPLDAVASLQDDRLVITSFNGGYIGYITDDQYYDSDHYETRLMNWYGPGNGSYFSACLRKLIIAMQHHENSFQP
jgi:hypothetical protein